MTAIALENGTGIGMRRGAHISRAPYATRRTGTIVVLEFRSSNAHDVLAWGGGEGRREEGGRSKPRIDAQVVPPFGHPPAETDIHS